MLPETCIAIEPIHDSGKRMVVAVTGGGSGAIAALLAVPGASRSVLEAIIPYQQQALEEWVGGRVEQACSAATARAMAMAAFERASQLDTLGNCLHLRGIGCTASLATDRPKRGPHRAYVAWQSAQRTIVVTVNFQKGLRTRAAEEELTSQLVLSAIAEACGVELPPVSLSAGDSIERSECHAPTEWTELLLGQRGSVFVPPQGATSTEPPRLLFPGAFNPRHSGHLAMARLAEARFGQPVTFELSIANVDKPPLDFLEIEQRLSQFTDRAVLLTRAPTFVAKAAIVPGATFIVGADTMRRIGETKYYDGDAARRDQAIETLHRAGCKFFVFGREDASGFLALNSLAIPAKLRELCEEVAEEEFREDVSSTELRAGEAV